jgi:hypothetical protein
VRTTQPGNKATKLERFREAARSHFASLLLGCSIIWTGSVASAQPRPYIGFVYPGGGQRGTTFQIRVGGQNIDDSQSILVTGSGVTARIAENYRRMNNQELTVVNEQSHLLRKRTLSESARESLLSDLDANMMTGSTNETATAPTREDTTKLLDKIERRIREYNPTPACASIASLMIIEVTVAADATPGERELRLVTLRGVSNPLGFHVGQIPETSRKPMRTATLQVLGKEYQALRERVSGDDEQQVTLPCTVNGQIASGEVHRFHFQARKGQRLVFNTLARQLVPFIADAVPGWFQPVLVLYDGDGKEVAYDDDYRFKPDPTILYEVPRNGEYVLAIHDSLYRGREDFVYRISMGESPFITSIFPLGARVSPPASASASIVPKATVGRDGDEVRQPQIQGWNLDTADLSPLPADAPPGIYLRSVTRKGFVSNRIPFALDTLPETYEKEPNNTVAQAQKVKLPVILNGRINKAGEWDVFQFDGKANDTIVAEVQARRLDSPLDSVIKLTDAAGKIIAFNDDHEDLASGINTHQADSYCMVTLPADGSYFVHVGDTARHGGEEYGYRLRLSAPRPDFDLRVVPSSLSIRTKSSAQLTVYAQRKDGFAGPIKLILKDASNGFSANPVTLSATQTVARINIKTDLTATEAPVNLSIFGSAKIEDQEISHVAIPAEDRMQAFLWRQLVPASELKVLVFDPSYQPPPRRIARPDTPVEIAARAMRTNAVAATGTNTPAKPKFTKQQIAGRLKELKTLFEEGMLTDEFYNAKVAECETEL